MSTNPFENIGDDCYITPQATMPERIDRNISNFFPHHSAESIKTIKLIQKHVKSRTLTLDDTQVMIMTYKIFNKYFYDCVFEDERELNRIIDGLF